jgi:5-methylcytosine-specific restriction protein A
LKLPTKNSRHCAFPGCPGYAEKGQYCAAHAAAYNKIHRDPERKKHYGRQWERLRTAFLSKHPLCRMCQEAGRLVPATEVHHIVPLADGGTDDEANLMPLCKPCHSRFTAGECWGKGE